MELKINVDETKFGELINDELSNFTKEEIHEICRNGLIKIMSNQDTLRYLLPEKTDYWSEKVNLNSLMKTAIEKIDLSPLFDDFQDMVRKFIEENHKTLIMDIMTHALVEGLSGYMDKYKIQEIIRDYLYASQQH
jgi:hypothetical protein